MITLTDTATSKVGQLLQAEGAEDLTNQRMISKFCQSFLHILASHCRLFKNIVTLIDL